MSTPRGPIFLYSKFNCHYRPKMFVVLNIFFVFRSSTVLVKVTLQDINDHIPTFYKQFYTVTVTESAAVNTTILTVEVCGTNMHIKRHFGHARINGDSKVQVTVTGHPKASPNLTLTPVLTLTLTLGLALGLELGLGLALALG